MVEPDRRLIIAMVAIGMLVGAFLSDGPDGGEDATPVASVAP